MTLISCCSCNFEIEKGTLCPEEERRLNEIGFIWNAYQGKWDSMIMVLTQFKQRKGLSCHISDKHIEHLDGGVKIKLGAWLKIQRYHQKRGRLDSKREKRLETLGVKWNKNRYRNFDLLLAFKKREGHVRCQVNTRKEPLCH